MRNINKISDYTARFFNGFGRVMSLIMAFASLSASVSAARLYYSTDPNPSKWTTYISGDALTQEGNVYTATLSGLTTESQNYYIALSTTDDLSGIYTSQGTACTFDAISGTKEVASQNYNIGSVRYQFIRVISTVSDIIVSCDNSTHKYTISAATATYKVSTSAENCVISPTASIVGEGQSATFTVVMNDGYEYSSSSITDGTGTLTVSADKTTFTVAPTANTTLTVTGALKTYLLTATCITAGGTVTPTTINVTHGTSRSFNVVPEDGFYLDKRNTVFTGDAAMQIDGNTITLSNVKSVGELKVAFASDIKPVVYLGAYPTQTVNNVNLNGYLVDRYCMEVKKTGFYWKTTNTITEDEVIAALAGGAGSNNIIPSEFVAEKAGYSFSKENVDLQLTETQVIYFVSYAVTTSGTGISRPVGFEYIYCNGIKALSISPETASLPDGFSTLLSATPRNAGKTPTYEWYRKVGSEYVLIPGESTSTYNFTKSGTETEYIKVKVSESNCGTSREVVSTIENCPTPTVSLAADKTLNTPWQDVFVTATVENSTKGTWSVTPDAEIVPVEEDGVIKAVFNGPVQSGDQTIYTVTYTAFGDCSNTDVRVSDSIQITIVKDTEKCD